MLCDGIMMGLKIIIWFWGLLYNIPSTEDNNGWAGSTVIPDKLLESLNVLVLTPDNPEGIKKFDMPTFRKLAEAPGNLQFPVLSNIMPVNKGLFTRT